jgi:hypothetical protein
MNIKSTHYENGYECLDELCKCGGTIQSTGWKKNDVMGIVVLYRQWICTKCKQERKDLREIEQKS